MKLERLEIKIFVIDCEFSSIHSTKQIFLWRNLSTSEDQICLRRRFRNKSAKPQECVGVEFVITHKGVTGFFANYRNFKTFVQIMEE
jgi:hypothetical protein